MSNNFTLADDEYHMIFESYRLLIYKHLVSISLPLTISLVDNIQHILNITNTVLTDLQTLRTIITLFEPRCTPPRFLDTPASTPQIKVHGR